MQKQSEDEHTKIDDDWEILLHLIRPLTEKRQSKLRYWVS